MLFTMTIVFLIIAWAFSALIGFAIADAEWTDAAIWGAMFLMFYGGYLILLRSLA